MKKLYVCIICHNIKRKLIFIIILLTALLFTAFISRYVWYINFKTYYYYKDIKNDQKNYFS